MMQILVLCAWNVLTLRIKIDLVIEGGFLWMPCWRSVGLRDRIQWPNERYTMATLRVNKTGRIPRDCT